MLPAKRKWTKILAKQPELLNGMEIEADQGRHGTSHDWKLAAKDWLGHHHDKLGLRSKASWDLHCWSFRWLILPPYSVQHSEDSHSKTYFSKHCLFVHTKYIYITFMYMTFSSLKHEKQILDGKCSIAATSEEYYCRARQMDRETGNGGRVQ